MHNIVHIACMALRMARERSPYDTGNLRENIQMRHIGHRQYEISIGGALAPYAVYTNEAWKSPKWNGAHNPNEHWIDITVQEIVNAIAQKVGGTVASADGEKDRWENKSYWSSPEGKKKLKEYNQ